MTCDGTTAVMTVGVIYSLLCIVWVPPEAVPTHGFKCRRFMWEVTLGEMGGGGSEEVRQKGRKAVTGMIYSKFPLWAA